MPSHSDCCLSPLFVQVFAGQPWYLILVVPYIICLLALCTRYVPVVTYTHAVPHARARTVYARSAAHARVYTPHLRLHTHTLLPPHAFGLLLRYGLYARFLHVARTRFTVPFTLPHVYVAGCYAATFTRLHYRLHGCTLLDLRYVARAHLPSRALRTHIPL